VVGGKRITLSARSNLRLAAIGERLYAGNETQVVRREEQRHAVDLVGIATRPADTPDAS
jgi:hypothetical protein